MKLTDYIKLFEKFSKLPIKDTVYQLNIHQFEIYIYESKIEICHMPK